MEAAVSVFSQYLGCDTGQDGSALLASCKYYSSMKDE
jgi:hypothetical protein